MNKYNSVIKLFLFSACYLSTNTFAVENKVPEPLSSKQAIERALDNNPNLAVINARFLALSEIPIQVRALPEPQFKFNVANLPLDSFALDQTPMTQIQLGITQALPYPGKLSLKAQIASQIATASNANWLDAKRELTKKVRQQWWQLFYLDHALEIIARNFVILEQFIEVAETKYSVGQGLQQDILLAQVESHRLHDTKLQITSMRETTQANLNNLMGKPSNPLIKIAKTVEIDLPKLNKSTEYLNQAKQQRPDMKREKLFADAAETRLALAKKDFYPDFQLSALYGWRKNQTGLASLQFSVNIPWDTSSRQNPAKDQRNMEWKQQKYAINALENRIAEEIQIAVSNFKRANQQVTLFSDAIIPKAEQMVEAMLAGYQVNKVDFLTLLRAQITLFNYETQYWQSISLAKQSLAALDAAIGQEVSHE